MNFDDVRRATCADIDAIAPLFDSYRQFYGKASDVAAARAFLQARLEREESVVLYAMGQQEVLGFTQLYPAFSSVSLRRTFILNDLYVLPTARRLGVASRLLAAAEDFARQQNALRLTLSTAIDNSPAQALYRRRGWKQDEQFLVFHFTAL